MPEGPPLGATLLGDGRCEFRVWAPRCQQVALHLLAPRDRLLPLTPERRGYFAAVVDDVPAGALYRYRLDGQRERPDPASRYQPEGPHGPSAVVDPRAFRWTDHAWRGVPQPELVFYELHVGTFTAEGTFDAIIPHLPALRELGVTALELMPVAQFPGARNWGYDGVLPFAVQNSYGGPEGLRRLVDACHARGLAVFLDVVYNHLGPEGNYLGDFGPYFTDVYHTPWGAALNFDQPHSDEVRHYFIQNGLHWLREYHLDGFRLDAVHAILDRSAFTFLQEWNAAVHREGRRRGWPVVTIAESDLNDARVLRPVEAGGWGFDGQWADDFHHALHALLTGERAGYYADYGTVEDLAEALRAGWSYRGRYSEYRRRRHGNDPADRPAWQFVYCTQNHDQVGNRARGDRLSTLVPFDALKLAAGALLLAPCLPLLFMGEEYGEPHPFPYFTSHTDPALAAAVSHGRREEFAAFAWQGTVPDPQAEATFRSALLQHHLASEGRHRQLREWYQTLLRLRRELPALAALDRTRLSVWTDGRVLVMQRWAEDQTVAAVLAFSAEPVATTLPLPAGEWQRLLDAAEPRWGGTGSTVPARITTTGSVALSLGSWACVVLARAAAA
ncbi:MAG: malto-oligosyltrehalose trehalohydrolase [Chloroflexi bacterium]|nr:malto-oligosyltrehalose trehalohydrolase [Chloroflexota bacterium]